MNTNESPSTTIPLLLSHLSTILTNQPLSTLPVLPPSVPPLPPTLSTLPPTTASNPLTHLTTLLETHILPYLPSSSLSPHYYGFITGGATPAALLSDWLVSTYDQNTAVHLPSESIATVIEVAALNLLVQLFQLPVAEWGVGGHGDGGGVITTGATASNVLGLAAGREWVVQEAARRKGVEGVVSVGELGVLEACKRAGVTGIELLSTLPHSSVVKAAGVVGIGRACVRDIGMGEDGLRIDLERFESVVREGFGMGTVFILAVSAGEVNTGRFATGGLEVMRRVREVCDRYGVWVHVDGAFGLFGRLLLGVEGFEEVVKGVEGIELADSITGDGHKLLNVPYDCGLAFTRHKAICQAVFQNGNAAYLTMGMGSEPPVVQSPMNIGIENSRRFRALPVWATLMTYGRAGYVDMLKRQIGLARRVTEWMWDVEELELVPECKSKEEAVEKTFMIVLFKARDDALNQVLVKKINGIGKMYITGTKWEGISAARIAVSNWQVDVERDFALVKEVLTQCISK